MKPAHALAANADAQAEGRNWCSRVRPVRPAATASRRRRSRSTTRSRAMRARCCSRWSARRCWCCSSPARTSRTCRSRARSGAIASSRSVCALGQPPGSSGNCSPKASRGVRGRGARVAHRVAHGEDARGVREPVHAARDRCRSTGVLASRCRRVGDGPRIRRRAAGGTPNVVTSLKDGAQSESAGAPADSVGARHCASHDLLRARRRCWPVPREPSPVVVRRSGVSRPRTRADRAASRKFLASDDPAGFLSIRNGRARRAEGDSGRHGGGDDERGAAHRCARAEPGHDRRSGRIDRPAADRRCQCREQRLLLAVGSPDRPRPGVQRA